MRVSVAPVDLKNEKVILPAKMGLFKNSRELQFGTIKLQQKLQASPANKEEGSYLIEKKEAVKMECFE